MRLSWQRPTSWSGKLRMAAVAMAGQDEQFPPPAPPVEPRGGRSRPSITVFLIVSNVCYISVMSFLLYMNGWDGGGDPEPREEAPSPAQVPLAPPPFDSAPNVLPRREGVKASTGSPRAPSAVNSSDSRAPRPQHTKLPAPVWRLPRLQALCGCARRGCAGSGAAKSW